MAEDKEKTVGGKARARMIKGLRRTRSGSITGSARDLVSACAALAPQRLLPAQRRAFCRRGACWRESGRRARA